MASTRTQAASKSRAVAEMIYDNLSEKKKHTKMSLFNPSQRISRLQDQSRSVWAPWFSWNHSLSWSIIVMYILNLHRIKIKNWSPCLPIQGDMITQRCLTPVYTWIFTFSREVFICTVHMIFLGSRKILREKKMGNNNIIISYFLDNL